MKNTFLLLAVAVLFFSCSSPLDKKYSDENLKQDATKIKEEGELVEEDSKLLGSWILKSKLQGEKLSDMTYREILNQAKNFRQEQEELAEKAKKEAEARNKKMQNAIVVSIFNKGFVSADYQSYNYFDYAVKNKSNKDIQAFKFNFNIYDALGDEISDGYQVSSTDSIIKANEEFKTRIFYNYNQFMDDDIKIKNAKFDAFIFNIRINKIVYTDGSTLE